MLRVSDLSAFLESTQVVAFKKKGKTGEVDPRASWWFSWSGGGANALRTSEVSGAPTAMTTRQFVADHILSTSMQAVDQLLPRLNVWIHEQHAGLPAPGQGVSFSPEHAAA
jgi:hypothetical protein